MKSTTKAYVKTIQETLGRGPIHPFPARMAPGIAFHALRGDRTPIRVLDPMAGSGTVLAVARAKGHHAIGFDLDPLSVLLSRVWTTTVDRETVRKKAAQVLVRARKNFKSLAKADAYPPRCDDESRKFIRYWFDDYARRQLAALSNAIRSVKSKRSREVLWCAFSRLIITKQGGASLAMDLSHSRPHKRFERAPAKPFRRFLSSVDMVLANCPAKGPEPRGPISVIKRGDARNLDLPDQSIDFVLTSPPYLNAIDYMRCSKFSLVWMGHGICRIRTIRSKSIGTERCSKRAAKAKDVHSLIDKLQLSPSLQSRDHRLLCQYVCDMDQALAEVARVLKKGGRARYVVGDSTIRGTFVSNSSIVKQLGKKHGLKIRSSRERELPENRRYLPPPGSGASKSSLNARMRLEVIITFEKRK